jgi:hypothetical protein
VVGLPPERIRVTEDDASWKASNQQDGDDSGGVFSVIVVRDPSVTDAWRFANLLRDDAQKNGADAGDVAAQDFVGVHGARYIAVYPAGAATLTVVAVSGKCVYVLLATRDGTKEEIVEYFTWALGLVRSQSGGPVNAPACR